MIINNVKSEYEGSQKDTEALRKAYEMMNFEIMLYEDCTPQVRDCSIIFNGFEILTLQGF